MGFANSAFGDGNLFTEMCASAALIDDVPNLPVDDSLGKHRTAVAANQVCLADADEHRGSSHNNCSRFRGFENNHQLYTLHSCSASLTQPDFNYNSELARTQRAERKWMVMCAESMAYAINRRKGWHSASVEEVLVLTSGALANFPPHYETPAGYPVGCLQVITHLNYSGDAMGCIGW